MRVVQKAKMTANYALLVKKESYTVWTWLFFVLYWNPLILLKMSSVFECLPQAGSRTYQAEKCVIHVLLGSTVSPWVPAPPGGAPVVSPTLSPAQLATSVPERVQTVSLSPALKALTVPAKVSQQQVLTQKLCFALLVYLLYYSTYTCQGWFFVVQIYFPIFLIIVCFKTLILQSSLRDLLIDGT